MWRARRIGWSAAVVAALIACVSAARAECPPEWLLGVGVPGVNGYVNAMTTWDPDGPGGQPELLVGGGQFTTAGGHVSAYWARWGCEVCRGDLNCDGVVSFADINPFVLALSNWTEWKATYPDCPERNGDVNGDGQYGGLYGFGDINPFVEMLAGSGGYPIPCE